MQELEQLYEKIPRIDCQQKCAECCQIFRIGEVEWNKIEARVGKVFPFGMNCPLLTPEGGCSIYDIRPTLCRLWYTVETNRCPHGCIPDRWLTEEEAQNILFASYELSQDKFAGPFVQIEAMLSGVK